MSRNRTKRPKSPARLYRNRSDGVVLGVCAGIADYFGLDRWLVRIATVFGLLVFTLPTVVAYLFAGWMLEPAPSDLYRDSDEESFWVDVRTRPSETARGLELRIHNLDRRIQTMERYVTSKEFELDREIRGLER